MGGEVDIAPTLAGILGFSYQHFYFMGRNLLRDPTGFVSLENGAVLSAGYYWLRDPKAQHGECYSRVSGITVAKNKCSAILSQAEAARIVSRDVVEENLIPKLQATFKASKGITQGRGM